MFFKDDDSLWNEPKALCVCGQPVHQIHVCLPVVVDMLKKDAGFRSMLISLLKEIKNDDTLC